jgi:hypothetical protein
VKSRGDGGRLAASASLRKGERGAQDMNCNCANLGSHEDRRLTRVRGMVFTCVLSLLIRLAGTYVCYLQAVDCA